MPFVSLFWQEQIFFIKLNWILYPILILGVFVFVLLRKKVSSPLILFTILSFFYFILFLIRGGDIEGFFRFFIAVLPFLFLPFFEIKGLKGTKLFFIFYILFFSPAIYMAYLQYSGQLPYNDFDYVDGEEIGRMSGGYSKPMNFIAFLTPLYILSLYFIVVHGKRLIGGIVMACVLTIIYFIGHRTSLAAFVLIAIAFFFKGPLFILIFNYYKYYFNFLIGVFSFLFFYLLKIKVGLVDEIRGRVPMWQAHAQEFFQADTFSILFGNQKVHLPDYYIGNPLIVRYDEVHNNSFRTILLFGLIGYFFYCTFMRWLVISTYHAQTDLKKRFIIFASLIYFMVYTITNEPFYYGSIVGPILIWVFLLRKNID